MTKILNFENSILKPTIFKKIKLKIGALLPGTCKLFLKITLE